MKVAIEYAYNYQPGIMVHTHWSDEIYVPDYMTDDDITEWYEQRHSGVHHEGISVKYIKHLPDSYK